jgi:hypothetical protein
MRYAITSISILHLNSYPLVRSDLIQPTQVLSLPIPSPPLSRKRSQPLRDLELGPGSLPDVLHGDALGELDEGQPPVDSIDVKDGEIGDDPGDDSDSGHREGTLGDDLGVTVFV